MRHALIATVFALGCLLPQRAQAQIPPHYSYSKLPVANGYGAVVLDLEGGDGNQSITADFFPRLYAEYAPGDVTPELLFDSYAGIRLDGANQWLDRQRPVADYENGAPGIITLTREIDGLVLTERIFAPQPTEGGPPLGAGYVHHLELSNSSDRTVNDAALFWLGNFHLGSDRGGRNTGAERAWAQDGALIEQGTETGHVLVMQPLGGDTRLGCSPQNPWATVDGGGQLSGSCDSGTSDDVVSGLQWSATSLAPGETLTGAVLVGYSPFGDGAGALDHVQGWLAGRDADQLLADERAWWQGFTDRLVLPQGLDARELRMAQQQAAFLKMAQVLEEGDAHGQLPASWPAAAPVGNFAHVWNITWVRDAAYAIAAMARVGLHDEARWALDFFLRGGGGDYTAYVGRAYGISIARCYGNGDEWSDLDQYGPNIEFDNFGLFLQAADEYVRASGDLDWYGANWDAIHGGVAEVLLSLIEPSGLLAADSSIWEEHWEGQQKHFTYSSLFAAVGLARHSVHAQALGYGTESLEACLGTARIQAGLNEHMLDVNGALAGNLEELEEGRGRYVDAAAVEAFNHGLFDPAGKSALATLSLFDERLRSPAASPGYIRNDDGELYDAHEWVMIDLRIATAWRRAGFPERADELFAWITDQAEVNHWIVPELLSPENADYAGPAPMMGFGAGAWLLHLTDRHGADVDIECGVEIDDCSGCHQSEQGADARSWLALGLAAMALAMRRTASLRRSAM